MVTLFLWSSLSGSVYKQCIVAPILLDLVTTCPLNGLRIQYKHIYIIIYIVYECVRPSVCLSAPLLIKPSDLWPWFFAYFLWFYLFIIPVNSYWCYIEVCWASGNRWISAHCTIMFPVSYVKRTWVLNITMRPTGLKLDRQQINSCNSKHIVTAKRVESITYIVPKWFPTKNHCR